MTARDTASPTSAAVRGVPAPRRPDSARTTAGVVLTVFAGVFAGVVATGMSIAAGALAVGAAITALGLRFQSDTDRSDAFGACLLGGFALATLVNLWLARAHRRTDERAMAAGHTAVAVLDLVAVAALAGSFVWKAIAR